MRDSSSPEKLPRFAKVEVDQTLLGARNLYEYQELLLDSTSEHFVPAPEHLTPYACRSKVTAFYLPQFHRLEVNDLHWGRGFTEWSNVTRARPQFAGHIQPRLPADLGFYDLQNISVLPQQIEMALHYGVTGFCFYHYWFGGQQLMLEPIRNFLRLNHAGMEFCLCWANETWTKRWDGSEQEVIINQPHSEHLDKSYIHDILHFLKHPSYRTINGKKVLIIYRPSLMGDHLAKVIHYWRDVAKIEGAGELMILGTSFFDPNFLGADDGSPLDGIVQFPPHPAFLGRKSLIEKILFNKDFCGKVDDYQEIISTLEKLNYRSKLVIPATFPSWDNTPRRRSSGHVFVNSNPARFKNSLVRSLRRAHASLATEGSVFINAWNEWAEGAILEPCRWYGHANLKACRDAIATVESGMA